MRRLCKFVFFVAILLLFDVSTVNPANPQPEYDTTTVTPVTTLPPTTITEVNANTLETTAPTPSTSTNLSEPLPTLAAKLVRQRRQHPYTIVRHVVRPAKRGIKSRRRQKWPKYKYGPPNYSAAPPISYYKPTKQYLPDFSVPPKYSPIDELDLTKHLNSAEYDGHPPLKSNHYEDQTMDLDFYSNTEHTFEEHPKIEHIEYSTYDDEKEVPTYSYTSTKTEIRKPHLPTSLYDESKMHGSVYKISSSDSGDSGYEDSHSFTPPDNVYDMHPMSSYERPSPSQGNKFYEYSTLDTSGHPNVHIPATKYGVPDTNIPLLYTPPAKQSSYNAPKPTPVETYSMYDKKLPNAGYNAIKSSGHHSFAEPPSKTNVEITYSPSYEITLPPSPANHKPASADNYHPVPGNFAEPPAPPTPSYHMPEAPPQPPTTYHSPQAPPKRPHRPPAPPPRPSYRPPDAHAPPSYQVPPDLHAPPPFEVPGSHEISAYDDTETHAPPSFQPTESHAPTSFPFPETHAPTSFESHEPPIQPPADDFEVPEPHSPPLYSAPEPPPQPPSTYDPPDSNYASPSSHSEYPQPDYISPSKNLPINSKYMPPAYNYPKSSYEVPIYDPIPFEASSHEEHETYPPHTFENQQMDSHSQSASSPVPTVHAPATHTTSANDDAPTSVRTTKGLRAKTIRKRLRNGTPAVNTKHILDTPELEEAFEASQRHKNQLALKPDAEVNESNHVAAQPSDEPNYFLPTITPDTNEPSYVSTAWNPIRIRSASTPTALPAAPAPKAKANSQTPVAAPAPAAVRPRDRRPNGVRQRQLQQQHVSTFTPTNGVGNTRQTTPLHSGSENVAVVSVNKSHSYSYYGGTSSLPNVNDHNLYRTRPNNYRQPTRAPTVTRQNASTREESAVPQRTTKSVFETTYFKSPHNDDLARHLSEFVRNLPKNHKLY
ncbi:adhesive plaque matrix protein [Ceratitis capitata]|uniref:adhesive plaque matrix protein n=1 Tax=Ceratitis capitata TaxID=7213 RepID=UPI0006188B02|nr:adhesive plaque matrix protein [Ceratitis capitata]